MVLQKMSFLKILYIIKISVKHIKKIINQEKI